MTTKRQLLEELIGRIDLIDYTVEQIDKRTKEIEKCLKPKAKKTVKASRATKAKE